MINKEIEDAILKALLNGEGQLISASELGMNDDDYSVNYDDVSETFYDMYKETCHLDNSLDPAQSLEKHRKSDQLKEDRFSCLGRVGYYEWYALTLYFNPSIHPVDATKEAYNSHHESTVCSRIYNDPGENLSKAINNDDNLINYLRNPIVANVSTLPSYMEIMSSGMEQRLNVFLGLPALPDKKLIKYRYSESDDEESEVSYEHISIDKSVAMGKDVIVPFLYADSDSLEMFGVLAKKISEAGANTVVGIFSCRNVPTIDGKEDSDLPNGYHVSSFLPGFGIML